MIGYMSKVSNCEGMTAAFFASMFSQISQPLLKILVLDFSSFGPLVPREVPKEVPSGCSKWLI